MRRKRIRGSEDNHDRWLISYADLITLLLGFFVVMYAVASSKNGSIEFIKHAISESLALNIESSNKIKIGEYYKKLPNSLVEPFLKENHKPLPQKEHAELASKKEGESLSAFDNSNELLNELLKQGLISVTKNNIGLEVELKSKFIFKESGSQPTPEMEVVIRQLAAVLEKGENPILIQGFTDNTPVDHPYYPSNWELSALRAAAIARLMTDMGVDPSRLVAIGYGQYRPINANSTEQEKIKNRRVVITIARNNSLLGVFQKADYKKELGKYNENDNVKPTLKRIELPDGNVKFIRSLEVNPN